MNDIALSPALLSGSGGAAKIDKNAPLRAQAEKLEGLFLNTLVSEMFKDVNARGMFGGGYAEETWRSMQAEQLSGQIAKSGGVGLADNIMQSLLALQESSPVNPVANAPQQGA